MDFRHAWLSLKKSMKCKTHPAEIYDPERAGKEKNKLKKQNSASSTTTHLRTNSKKLGNSSPYSIASNEIPEPPPMLLGHSGSLNSSEKNVSKSKTKGEEGDSRSMVLLQEEEEEEENGDTTRRNVVEMIFRASRLGSENHEQHMGVARIHQVLKINNMAKRLESFEEYRETVKQKACKSERKHARCIADGNELLRFHGTSVACCPGPNTVTPCALLGCEACRIIESGLRTPELVRSGIVTAATSGAAHRGCSRSVDGCRRAVLVCRVISGRIRKPDLAAMAVDGEFSVPLGFDSVAVDSKLEELLVSNPNGVLPCFLVVYSLLSTGY